jgi:L-cysteine/cystine lyase
VTSMTAPLDIAAIRRDMPALDACIYLNTGSRGPMARPVVDAWSHGISEEFERGRQGPWYADARKGARKALRQGLADILSVPTGNLAITTSTSDAMAIILMAHRWQAGDEIVTTDSEFPSLITPLALLARRHGVVVRVARMPVAADGGDRAANEAAALEAIAAAMTARTRLVAVSHVIYGTGFVLPAAQLAAMVHEKGAALLLDGAQSFGAMKVSPAAEGVDYYTFPAQKWLGGPEGLGGLYIATCRLDGLELFPTRTAEIAEFDGRFVPRPGALRFEAASFDLPRLMAGAAATERFLALGPEAMFARNHLLAQRFVDGLAAIAPARRETPEGFANLVGFELQGWEDKAAVAQLRTLGYSVRRVPGNLLRISFAYFNLESEVDGLLEAVAGMAKRGEVA